jgi:hypothetical protein
MAFTVLTEAFHEATALLLQQKDAVAVKMYIEFVTNGGTVPTITESDVTSTSDHNAYYSGLGVPSDYLRVDVAQFSRVVASGHYQAHNTLAYSNNKITFTGFTSDGGDSGILGRLIASGNVYGAAIAISDTSVDSPADDVIIARAYFDSPYTQVTATKGASVQIALNLVSDGACTAFGVGSITFTDTPASAGTITLIDNADTPVTKVFEFISSTATADGSTVNAATGSGSATNICVGTSGITSGSGTATFTFGDTEFDDTNDETITLIDAAGTSKTYTIKNDYGAVGDLEFNAGGTATAAASNFEAAVEGSGGHNGTITVTTSSGEVTMTQATAGVAGNTTIAHSAGWDALCDVNVGAAFTGGATNLETIEDRFEGAVNGAPSFAITASDDAATSGKCTLTQDYCSSSGNTTITDSATNVTTVSFTGGA